MRGEQEPMELRYPGWPRVVLGAVGDIVLFAALSLVIWTILPVVALGATPIVISGASMTPLVRVGDVMLLDDAAPPDGELFAPGTIITYETTDAAGETTGELVTHRVAGVADGSYVTRGDANASDDPRTVRPEQVVGAGRWLVPVIGLPAHWARTGAWHLVLATLVGGMAAFAASAAGRRRIAVLDEDEVGAGHEDQDASGPAPDPSVPEPVLAFALGATEPEAHDGGEMSPAAAEHAATNAAQAARRGMAGLGRLREEERERADDAHAASRDEGTSGATGAGGSAPIASVIALAVALLAVTLVPTPSAAVFAASSANGGNTFSVAAPASDDLVLVLPQHPDGVGSTVRAANAQHTASFRWEFTTEHAATFTAGALANVEVRSITPGNGTHRAVTVEVTVDGEPFVSGHDGFDHPTNGWVQRTIQLGPSMPRTLPAGSTVRVEVTLDRLEMLVDGATTIVIPHS